MFKLILVGMLSFSVAQANEVADAISTPKTQPQMPRNSKVTTKNRIPQILQELHKADLELKKSEGSACPAGNFEVDLNGKDVKVTIFDKKENGFYFGNGLVVSVSPSERREYSDMVKTPTATYACHNVVTKDTKVRDKLSVVTVETIERTCNGIKTTTKTTFEVHKVRGGKLNVSYKSETLNDKGTAWSTDQLCLYKPPRQF